MNTDNNHRDEKMLLEDERIANYLKGKMTADEEREFMQELQANPELKAKAIAMARMVKGMKEVGAANDEEIISEFQANSRNKIGGIAKDAINFELPAAAERAAASRAPGFGSWGWLFAAASVALLIWGGIGYFHYRSTTGLGNQYSTVFTSSQLTRGGENGDVEQKLANLIDNVAQKRDMDNTLHELALCWELATQNTYNDYTDYAPEIGWHLAIGYLKDNDKKNAKAVLEKLTDVAPSGTTIGDKARELLKKVNEL